MTGSQGAPARIAPVGGTVTVTGVAQRQAWRAHELPPVEQVRSGVWSMPVTIPDNPLRYTLAYLLLSDTGAVVVDPGWDSERGWQDLQAGFETAGVSADRVTGIVVTHVHLDHHGLSRRLSEVSGASIAMHTAEVQALPSRIREAVGSQSAHICLYDADHGVLLTGDHLLPRISPNIGLTPGSMDSPLTSYLNSLGLMGDYARAGGLA